MRITICICEHCGSKYQWQASGCYNVLETPKEYQSPDYCPECKKAIVETLNKIPVKFKEEYVETTEVTLAQLKQWEINYIEEEKEKMANSKIVIFPKFKRVFPKLYDTVNQELQVVEEVIGRDDFRERQYIYSYWPSKIEEATISVKKRIEIATGKETGYVYEQ